MGEQRRAVVTGIGAVTPLGNDAAQTWEGLKSGRSGIGPITLFDTENFKQSWRQRFTALIRKNIWK